MIGKSGFLPCLILFGMALPQAQSLTTLKVANPSATAKSDAVLTLGMLFRKGDIPADKSPVFTGVTYQVDPKATYSDGSLKHAVVSLALGSMAANDSRTLAISAGPAAAAGSAIDPADVLKTAFDAKVTVVLAGQTYSASARDYLAGAAKWLSGPVCTDWLITAPLKTAAGAVHPQLHVRFSIRAYQGLKSIRADVTVENDWAFEPSPSGYTYDVSIAIGGTEAYAMKGLPHTHHARWRKVFWWGSNPGIEYEYDRDYLFATGAFPMLDRAIKASPAALAGLAQDFAPMSNGDLESYMPTTGAHTDIGPLPNFTSLYLLSQDPRARANMLANSGCGGSYAIHLRHKPTDLPVTIDAFPYMTVLGNDGDADNPNTGKSELFPKVTNPLDVHEADDAHQPSIAFVPYVVTGDYFHLEELQFWANWNMVIANPHSRGFEKGLLNWGQLRAQAWSMRTLGQAAFITPDAHPLKAYFNDKLANNLAWYADNYPKNPKANPFGYMEVDYPYPPFGLAPWMDDFFTWSMAYLYRMGFEQARPIAEWKAKFVVGRLTASGYCWLKAGIYSLQVGTADLVPYATWADLFQANFPGASCSGLEMDGYPAEATGYGANMQPALAAAVDLKVAGAEEAWAKYQTRNPKQDYSSLPEFGVVPEPAGGLGLGKPKGKGESRGSSRVCRLLPGNRVAFRLESPSEVYEEIYDTSGHVLLTASAGKFAKGEHDLDPLRLAGAPRLGKKPYLLRVRAKEPSGLGRYLEISAAGR